MPVPSTKRSRIGSSSSSNMISHLPPKVPEQSDRRLRVDGESVRSAAKALKMSPETEMELPRTAILMVASPETVTVERPSTKVDQFLEECYLCRKRLSHETDVFMYGHFRAFCSEVCRFQQIYKDTLAEKTAVNSVN